MCKKNIKIKKNIVFQGFFLTAPVHMDINDNRSGMMNMLPHSEKLRKLLEKKGIDFQGNFRFLGYNPPYQFLGRRNEIIISVNWSEIT